MAELLVPREQLDRMRDAYRTAETARIETTAKLDSLRHALARLIGETRPYDNGRGEGDYFADELQEVLDAHAV